MIEGFQFYETSKECVLWYKDWIFGQIDENRQIYINRFDINQLSIHCNKNFPPEKYWTIIPYSDPNKPSDCMPLQLETIYNFHITNWSSLTTNKGQDNERN